MRLLIEMKGDEGRFLVVPFVTFSISSVYADRMKGEGLFSFRLSNFCSSQHFSLFYAAYLLQKDNIFSNNMTKTSIYLL